LQDVHPAVGAVHNVDVAAVVEPNWWVVIDWGPGYRVCISRLGQIVVLLLCGGDKTTQQKDIERAKELFDDYKVRSAKKPKPRRGA
jgi:putative addiction module killer protein